MADLLASTAGATPLPMAEERLEASTSLTWASSVMLCIRSSDEQL